MIEVIYDKSKDSQGGNSEEGNAISIGLKLPKNIRQMGSPSGNKRIYIEDYVITYLNYIARPGSTGARGAILLGDVKKSDIGDVIFVSGAVDAQNIEFDMDETEFTEEVWSEIYEQVKEFFPELSVVGWFLSRMGFSTAINEKIEKTHVENFPGSDKVLFITDSLECDDAFYMYNRGQLVKQKGYYIYYSKNESMQEYIVHQKGDVADTENNEIRRKDEELIKTFREKSGRTQGTKSEGINLIYVASSFVVLAMLAMGITVISNYDKVKDIEISLNRLELTAEGDGDYAEVMNNTAVNSTEKPLEDITVTGTEVGNIIQTQLDVNLTSEANSHTTHEILEGTAENVSTEQALPVINDVGTVYYTIKEGDTLGTIALQYYGDVQYVEDIARANNMSIEDKIYMNQVLIIPDID